MKPDRYAWLHAEQQRRTQDPYGFSGLRAGARRSAEWHLGGLLAILPVMLPIALTEGRAGYIQGATQIGFGLIEIAAAILVWRVIKFRTRIIRTAGWTALIFGTFLVLLGAGNLLGF